MSLDRESGLALLDACFEDLAYARYLINQALKRIKKEEKDEVTNEKLEKLEKNNDKIEKKRKILSLLDWKISHNKNSILHCLVYCDKIDAIKLLLSHGATVDILNKNLQTPLHISAITNNTSSALLLLNNGANLNYQDHTSSTPLHYAASLSNLEMVVFLLTQGADVQIRDKDNNTALDTVLLSIPMSSSSSSTISSSLLAPKKSDLVENSTKTKRIASPITPFRPSSVNTSSPNIKEKTLSASNSSSNLSNNSPNSKEKNSNFSKFRENSSNSLSNNTEKTSLFSTTNSLPNLKDRTLSTTPSSSQFQGNSSLNPQEKALNSLTLSQKSILIIFIRHYKKFNIKIPKKISEKLSSNLLNLFESEKNFIKNNEKIEKNEEIDKNSFYLSPLDTELDHDTSFFLSNSNTNMEKFDWNADGKGNGEYRRGEIDVDKEEKAKNEDDEDENDKSFTINPLNDFSDQLIKHKKNNKENSKLYDSNDVEVSFTKFSMSNIDIIDCSFDL